MRTAFKEIGATVRRRLTYYRAIYADQRTPRISRWLLWAALAYLALPFDVIPDFIPVLGYLDDVLIVPGLICLALWFVPQEVCASHAKLLEAPSASR